jgi:hypothetical protein
VGSGLWPRETKWLGLSNTASFNVIKYSIFLPFCQEKLPLLWLTLAIYTQEDKNGTLDLYHALMNTTVNRAAEQEYSLKIEDYKRKLQEVRRAEKVMEDPGFIKFLDKERDDIHQELRELAPLIGKGPQDIIVDILVSDRDLSTYNLPEFKIMRTAHALDKISTIKVFDTEVSRQDLSDIEELPQEINTFIPFGEQDAWHLFDQEGYISRQPTELERRRRAARAVQLSAGKAKMVEVSSWKTFHNAVTLYGIACSAEDFEAVLSSMRNNRQEVSIDKRFFDQKQVRKDWEQILREDFEYILNRIPDQHESRTYLVRRLSDHLKSQGLAPELSEIINIYTEQALQRAEKIEHEEVMETVGENEVKNIDRAETLYQREMERPTKEAMGRRSRK